MRHLLSLKYFINVKHTEENMFNSNSLASKTIIKLKIRYMEEPTSTNRIQKTGKGVRPSELEGISSSDNISKNQRNTQTSSSRHSI